jgi:hypothetical protein
MARMIPGYIDSSSPHGERSVYNMLADGPADWVVLHSLDLAPWESSRRTELDFLVFIPDQGILCLEVKSHQAIGFDGQRWYPDSIKRSPFKQVLDARFAFRRHLTALDPLSSRIPVTHCCIFPNARFQVASNVSVANWEFMDGLEFRSYRTAAGFCEALRERLRRGREAENIAELERPLSPTRIESILARCLPIQRRRPSATEEIRERQRELDSLLLEKQKQVLALCEMNDRVVVEGAAGTGKTLIAMEVAMRAAEQGYRVGFMSFNRLVGEWMASEISARRAPPSLVTGSALSILARMADIEVPSDAVDEFWLELPNKVLDRLTDPDFAATAGFEYLVIDEAQDTLSRAALWQSLLGLLDGGLANGRFAIFGDFACQVLNERDKLAEALDELGTHARPARWRLTENCRNFRSVASAALRLSGFPEATYADYRRSGGTINDISFRPYDDFTGQVAALREALKDARSRGYASRDITVLSFCAPGKSAASELACQGEVLRPPGLGRNEVTFSSVSAFKGLENKVIIITNVDLGMGALSRALFYTALTRSTGIVYVLCSSTIAQQLIKWASEANR